MMKTSLTNVDAGESVLVVELMGGHGMHNRLEQLGIRKGTVLTIVRAPGVRGPVVVSVGGSQVAVGFGIASRILVEVDRA